MARKSRPRKASPRRRKGARQKRGGFGSWLKRLFLLGAVAVFLAGAVALIMVDVVVRAKFDGKKWSLPAHVYGRPVELYQGQSLALDDVRRELLELGYRERPRVTSPGQYSVSGSSLELYTRGFAFWDGMEEARYLRLQFAGRALNGIVESGRAIPGPVRLEPLLIGGIYPDQVEDRELVRLDELPPLFVPTLLAVEDRHFYNHHGISVRGIMRAFWTNLRAGGVVQGGSTLTQQLVKNFYLTHERSLWRKAMEAVMAVSLEIHYEKDEILETYINEVYLGQTGRRAVHGFGLASRHYFQQPLHELELHQIALLVGVVKGASFYNPWNQPERALARRNVVLDLLEEQGVASARQVEAAKTRPLDVVQVPTGTFNRFPAFMDLIRRQLQTEYRDSDLREEGLKIFTSLDTTVQRNLQTQITQRLDRLETDYRIDSNALQAASVVVDVGTGEIIALAGGRRAGFAGFNRALDARRQTGSTIKPAVYLAALERPERYTLATLIKDEPFTYTPRYGPEWSPRNYSRDSYGEVPLYLALARSYNLATARLGLDLTVEETAKVLRRLGYEGSIPQLPSLLLGAIDMSPLEVAGIYQTIASGGFHIPLRAIHAVHTSNNEPLRRYPYKVEQRFGADTMHLMQFALHEAMRDGTGRGANALLPEDLVVAGKTGTTNDQRDSWFAGFSGGHLAVVWVGRDDNQRMPLTGSTGALRVWADVMANMPTHSLSLNPPEGVEYHWVSPDGAHLSEEQCAGARYLPFVRGSEPKGRLACGQRDGQPVRDWLRDTFGWE